MEPSLPAWLNMQEELQGLLLINHTFDLGEFYDEIMAILRDE